MPVKAKKTVAKAPKKTKKLCSTAGSTLRKSKVAKAKSRAGSTLASKRCDR